MKAILEFNLPEEEAEFKQAANTGEMWSFLLVNALRCLTEEQRASLCFDLYCRNELTESIDERIRKLKEERQ